MKEINGLEVKSPCPLKRDLAHELQKKNISMLILEGRLDKVYFMYTVPLKS